MSWFEKLHCHLWFKLHMVNAYTLYHQGRMVECAEEEAKAAEYERRLITDEVSRRFV
jgi:hypothetical protein